jgi:polysaccharide export outer membrane protein
MKPAQTMKVSARYFPVTLLSTVVLIGLLVSGCSSQQAQRSPETDERAPAATSRRDTRSASYIIQCGDQVQLTVFGYPEFNASVIVQESGTIVLPLVGELQTSGLTREQLTNQLVTKLGEYVKSKVIPSVTIVDAMSHRVVVLGSVGNQGNYQLTAPASPFQVLAMAGGPSKDADVSHVKVLRRSDPTNAITLDLSGYVSPDLQRTLGGPEELPLINPGDMIVVPKEENIIRDFADLLRDAVLLFSLFALIR